MKDSIRHKLETVRDRFEELAGLLADPDVIGDQNQFRELSMEYARLEPVVKLFAEFETLTADMGAAEEMANDTDAEIRQMGEDELGTLRESGD
ncbi:MAG: PCRF domain-containing protein, partial [Pseudomonadota bacterium]